MTECVKNDTFDTAVLKKIQARFYELASGRKPVRDWLLELDDDDRRAIGRDLQTVEYGWPIGMPVCRPMGHGLWEVRTDLSRGRIGRVLFCIVNRDMVLLHGFEKTTQKTQKRDLDLALSRMKEII